MVLKNSFNFVNEFLNLVSEQIRKIYLNSKYYNKKISIIDEKNLDYKPSQNLFNCIFKYEKKREKIENYYINSIWTNETVNYKDYKKLHSFFWLFTLDLKSSKRATQSIILNWIEANLNYNPKNWEIDILSKRLISWISNSKLTYEDSNIEYKKKFNFIVKKQINHLINEIKRSEVLDDKLVACTAIILTGLSYKDEKFLTYGIDLLYKFIKYSLSEEFFPKSRSIRQLIFYLKYLVLIRELLNESQNEIPEYLNETIFYLGQSYNFLWQKNKRSFLFNGNYETNNEDFDNYLELHGYKFKNVSNEIGGYSILKNKNTIIVTDLGPPPEKKFSNDYQSGTLSFEMIHLDKKLICNSGYYLNHKHQLNSISRSTAAHSTLIINNNSVSQIKRDKNYKYKIINSFKVFNKKIVYEKNYWNIKCSHDGYLKKYGAIHQRELIYYPEINKLVGKDSLLKKKKFKSTNFEIRFHFLPETKVTKTQDEKAILIELENSGWRFYCKDHLIDIDTGLYFGNKNSSVENQNIYISGITQNNEQIIEWEIKKI